MERATRGMKATTRSCLVSCLPDSASYNDGVSPNMQLSSQELANHVQTEGSYLSIALQCSMFHTTLLSMPPYNLSLSIQSCFFTKCKILDVMLSFLSSILVVILIQCPLLIRPTLYLSSYLGLISCTVPTLLYHSFWSGLDTRL